MINFAALTLTVATLHGQAPTPKVYGPQVTPAVTYIDLSTKATGHVDSTPGLIRPVSPQAIAPSVDDHPHYACADRDCKTTYPAYNTRTPLERELARPGSN